VSRPSGSQTEGIIEMFLGAYHFEGEPGALLAAYEQLLAGFPPGVISLQLCASTERGIAVYDACPSREVFRAFSTSADLHAAFASVGLPGPRVEEIGELHRTTVADRVDGPR
jgi:hypothetical protein